MRLNERCLSLAVLLSSQPIASGFLSTRGFDHNRRRQGSVIGSQSSVALQRQAFFSRTASRSDGNDNYFSLNNDDEEEEDDDEYLDIDVVETQDWRSFRAKLVMGESFQQKQKESAAVRRPRVSNDDDEEPCEPMTGNCDMDGIGAVFKDDLELSSGAVVSDVLLDKMTPLDPSQWAYDTGKVIEKGAVILGGVEQEWGFGLRQQYFHKAAILVLDHEETTFTKGIILNRPTDLTLEDDVNPGVKWRVWFGGDVQGFNAAKPDIICLHSLKSEQVTRASVPIMKDIQWTTFENAKRLVKAGAAKPTDFWVFCGYAGWGPHQLMGELDRKSWYMVATDSQTLLKELARQASGSDPRDSGLETWSLLMTMIGRNDVAHTHSGGFDDLMLKEWARKHLLSSEAGGGAGEKRRPAEGVASTQELLRKDPVERLISRASAASRGEDITPGMLVRAAPSERSPFLLENQELHKSVVLILSDDERITVGAMLNRPAAKTIDFLIQSSDGQQSKTIALPLRFGGQFSTKDGDALLWLHNSKVLRIAKIGTPVGPVQKGIWKCSSKDVTDSITSGIAKPEDFIVLAGVSVWTKGEGGIARGIQGEIRTGKFQVVPLNKMDDVWDVLATQDVLTKDNLENNMKIGEKAWEAGGEKNEYVTENNLVSISGLGENYDEEDDTTVFKTNVKVSDLCDEALRHWVANFLLGWLSLGN